MFEDLGAVSEIPMTFNGTAKHNIQNVLGVVGLARALKLTFNAIRAGLQNFGSDADDNPGRGNRYHVGGREIIVDFAHNEHSMRAVVDMVNRMPADNKVVMFGHAGDRSDKDIEDLTNAVVKLQADHYIVAELEPYLRGRALGDIPAIVRRTLGKHNIPDQKFSVTEDPMSGAQLALSMTGSGDVLLLFVLDQRQKVHEWLTTQT
jgi:UDP-N-acetylmuramyl tripeptide synthase